MIWITAVVILLAAVLLLPFSIDAALAAVLDWIDRKVDR